MLLFIPLAFILFGITFFIIIPLKRMSFYKREGTTSYFFPLFGPIRTMKQDFNLKHDILASSKAFSKECPNQKLFVSNINNRALVILRDTKYIREFLQNSAHYKKDLSALTLYPLMGSGLVLAEGETWKRHRKIVSNSFNYDFLKSNISAVQSTTQEFLNALTSEDFKSYSAIAKIQEITGEIVGRIFFGKNLNQYTFESKPITLALADLVADLALTGRSPLVIMFGSNILNFPLIPKFVRLMKKVRDFRDLCAQIIQDRKKDLQKTNDLLMSLLATQQSENPELRFSDEDIINEFITFFVAGMDTTGHLIGMTLYNLTQYPEFLQDLKEERENTYNQEAEVTADTLQKMNVLHSVLKETLRFDTPAPATFARVALYDHKLADLSIRKGDLIRPDFLPMFFDEKNFEDPKKFDPSRWTVNKQSVDPYAYIPFSAGPRNCIGQHLAIIEAKIIISEFLERFEFSVEDNYKLRMTFRFLYEPHEEIRLHLKPISKC